jgi:hypothetical protein
MGLIKRGAWVTSAILASTLTLGVAHAEPRLTDFDGAWQGSGTDRSTPLESTQQTKCSANITADLRHMSTFIVCNGAAGLTKVIQTNITLGDDGNVFSGNLTQKATTRGESETDHNGTVSGQKTDTTADFTVSFPGLTPSVHVILKLISPSSFSMQATTLGGQLMNVAFSKASKS